MRILITGARGMLGRTLARQLAPVHTVFAADREDFDIADSLAVERACGQFRPQAVLHCAAMTHVDDAESQPEPAFRVNGAGSAHVAAACHQVGARLIAFSTDYVFDGGLDRPYQEDDIPNPQTVYGKSKLAGELAIRRHCPNHLLLRVAWLYGAGGPSFVHTMLRLGSQPGPPLKVVADQLGNPTSADAVAERVLELLDVPAVGTWHLTADGEATWYQFARAIAQLVPFQRTIVPCTTADCPRPARRPANSRLQNRLLERHGLRPMDDWQRRLRAFLDDRTWRAAA
jgi:dTDP-4-dehydrorhamnose reductase